MTDHLLYILNICSLLTQQDFDQNKLEEEMRKRKERVEKWREEQRKKAIENIGEIKKELEEMKQGKKWSLEDDDGEEAQLTSHLSFVNQRLTNISSFQTTTRISQLPWKATMMKMVKGRARGRRWK